jgi:hypothetical protein
MKNSIFIVFLLVYLNIYSQNKFYLDEGNQKIDSLRFEKKCKKSIFKCFDVKIDDTIIKKVYHKFRFGVLTNTQKERLFGKLNNDFNKNIIIKYYDSLRSFSEYKMRHIKYVKKHNKNNKTGIVINNREYNRPTLKVKTDKELIKTRQKWIKENKKCIDKYQYKKVNVFYYYGFGTTSFYDDFNWIKTEDNFIKNTFFRYMYNYQYVVIKPNGEYLLVGAFLSDARLKKLLKTNNWNKYKQDLKKSKSNIRGNRFGFFRKETHKKHCF